jgi:hypothetical protein
MSPADLGGIKVKRDMEVVRTLLRGIQEKSDLHPRQLKFDEIDDLTAGYHISMLLAAGYIDGFESKQINQAVPIVFVKGLTWEGHDLAGALLTDETTWDKLKSAIGPEKLVTMPLKVVEAVATKALTAWASAKLGI